MKICLETVAEAIAHETELAEVKKYNDGKPAELMHQVKDHPRVDGISAGVKALSASRKKKIAAALREGKTGGGQEDWHLLGAPESRAKFPEQWKAKVDAIVAQLEA